MKTIKILGGGCPKCAKLYDHAKEAAAARGVEAEILKVTDMAEIMRYSVLSTPALVIDEKVISTGQILSSDTIADLL